MPRLRDQGPGQTSEHWAWYRSDRGQRWLRVATASSRQEAWRQLLVWLGGYVEEPAEALITPSGVLPASADRCNLNPATPLPKPRRTTLIETIQTTVNEISSTLSKLDKALKASARAKHTLPHLPAAESLVALSRLKDKVEDVAGDLHAILQAAAQGELPYDQSGG
jgi:hypothetical protein